MQRELPANGLRLNIVGFLAPEDTPVTFGYEGTALTFDNAPHQ